MTFAFGRSDINVKFKMSSLITDRMMFIFALSELYASNLSFRMRLLGAVHKTTDDSSKKVLFASNAGEQRQFCSV
jgi:hypothetical protein